MSRHGRIGVLGVPGRILGLGLLLIGAASGLPVQDEEPEAPFVRCTKCQNLGAKPCREHARADCQLEDNVLYCSHVAGCEGCGGTGWLDCADCENEACEERLAEKRAGVPALREELAKLDEEMKRPLRVAASEHFVLVCEVEGLKVEKRPLSSHQVLHLYVDRLERLFADYLEILGAEESEFKQRVRVMMWSNPRDHKEGSMRFCGCTGDTGVKLLGLDPTYSVPVLKQYFKNDETLHRNVVHCTVHLLLSHQRPMNWIGNKKGGWADAGLAHWFEERYWGKCDNFCYQEVDTKGGYKGGKWKPAVRKLVALGKASSLGQLFQQNTTTLTMEQHAICFSLVDHLMAQDPEDLNRVLRRLRGKVPTRDAIKEVYGLTVPALEEQWRQWVLSTYPAR